MKDFKTIKMEPAKLKDKKRRLEKPKTNDEELGPLKLLPGKWANLPNLPGRGWNMIALPFVAPPPGGSLPPQLSVAAPHIQRRA